MSRVPDPAYILRPGDGRSIDLGIFRMTVKATVEQTPKAAPSGCPILPVTIDEIARLTRNALSPASVAPR
jgi:hypothetical protein